MEPTIGPANENNEPRKAWHAPQCSKKSWHTPQFVAIEFHETRSGSSSLVPEVSSGGAS
jgi:hypothetical protein